TSGGIAVDVAISGTKAFVAETFYLDIVSITNPASPTLLGQTTGFGNLVERIAVSGTKVYATNNNDGLLIYDATNPAAIIYDGIFHDKNGPINAIAASGSYVYL